MQVYAIAIQKGGTAKTTTAAILSQAAAVKNKRVLAIDLDPQANLTFTLGADANSKGSFELITGAASAADVIQHLNCNIDVIAASWNLSTLKTERGSAKRLQTALEPLKSSYDVIFIDTPPTIGELQYNALQAATGLIIPLQADIYNLQSLYQIADTAKQFQNSNPALTNLYFIITQADSRSTLARQMQQSITIKANALDIKYIGAVRSAVAVKEAATVQQSIYEYAPKSKPAEDYLAILEQLI